MALQSVLTRTNPPGTNHCTDYEGLQVALASGAKQILAGQYVHELANALPMPHHDDILQLVAESRLLHGMEAAAMLAHAIHVRVHLTDAARPVLQLVLAELLQNAIEHGNLGLSLTRNRQVTDDEWFTRYNETVETALKSPMGRVPLHISCRLQDGALQLAIADRGMGFLVSEKLREASREGGPTGRGIGLIQKLVHGTLTYEDGGRIAKFSLPVRPRKVGGFRALRASQPVLAWAGVPQRAPVLERALRSAGVQNLVVETNGREILHHMSPETMLVMDASVPNFAQLAYLVGDVQRKFPGAPTLLWGHRGLGAAIQLALHNSCMDVASADLSAEELALRLERLFQTSRALTENLRQQVEHRQELERTREFQQDLLPNARELTELAQQHKVQLACTFRGCETLAGDYWSVRDLGEGKLGLIIMDFTGHGIRAALNTVQLHTLLQTVQKSPDLPQTVRQLNHHLHRLLGPGCFAAYAYVVYEAATGNLTYCAGGAPSLWLKKVNGTLVELSGSGVPLGLSNTIKPELRAATVGPGETLLLCSDALTDAQHHNGERWGHRGVAEAWRKLPAALSAHQALEGLLERFHQSVILPIPDDLTVLALKRPATGKAEAA